MSAAMREISAQEVSLHNKPDDLWIVYEKRVYNVTAYLAEHPGGRAMLRQGGGDATDAIKAQAAHRLAKAFIERTLPPLCIGRLK